ncbi:MAG: Uma2 family endonuclease [Selenomonadaceae bacterium]|nr:Uma2 family endonuclease [Selenomonadaceae bacterium]
MENLSYGYELNEDPDFEIIGGEKFIMAAAAPFVNHITIISRLNHIFVQYIDEKNINAIVVADADVYLSNEDHFRPDLSIVCNLETVKNGKKVYGVPDLVVEVLSDSTMKNDLGLKKSAYEKNGVKEYWIIDQWSRRIEVYHLINGKYELDDVYKVSDDEENKNLHNEIKVSIFDDLIVDIRNVFKWWFKSEN